MLATLVISLAAYPLFVCMRTPHKRAGSIFGIFYCILWYMLLMIYFDINTMLFHLKKHSVIENPFQGNFWLTFDEWLDVY